jgi:hypothetical protein
MRKLKKVSTFARSNSGGQPYHHRRVAGFSIIRSKAAPEQFQGLDVWSIAMLAKCANPPCSASFHHFGEGRLFRLEAPSALRSSKSKAAEYSWLSKACSAAMTLPLAQDGSVVAIGLREAPRNGPQVAFISASRDHDVSLRNVIFLRGSTPREA